MIARRRRGAGLVDALVTLALAAIILAGAASVGGKTLRRARVAAAANAAASDLRRIRALAITEGRHHGMRFARDDAGEWHGSFLADGDGDGIRTDDLRRGIDVVVEGPFRLRDRWGVPPAYLDGLTSLTSPPPDEQRLQHLLDPVRFGVRDIVSCSPRGTITPGTLYLSDGTERQFAVVVAGASGRVRTWEYLAGPEEWVLR